MTKILEGNIIKKAHKKEYLTEKQINEIKKCSNPKVGCYYWMTHYAYLSHPTMGKLLYKPFAYQVKLIQNYHEKRLNINMLGRQLGKCVDGDSLITVRNKNTGKEMTISIEEFHNLNKV